MINLLMRKGGIFISRVCVCAGDASNSNRPFNHTNMALHKDIYKAIASKLSVWSSL